MPVVNTSQGPVLESFCDPNKFGINIVNWITSTGVTAAPTYPFEIRRIHDAALAWYGVEPTDGNFDFTKFDQVMANLAATGKQSSYGFCFPAAWASAAPGVSGPYGLGSKGPPALMDRWRRYVRTVMLRYGYQFAFVEGWNEANLALYWNDTIANLIQWHNAMYEEVKRVCPAMPVASYPPTALNALSMPDNGRLLEDFLALGAKCDMLTAHIYVNTALTMPNQLRQAQRMIADMAQVGRKYGMPVVLTEVGQQNWNSITELEREQYLKRTMMIAAAYGCGYIWYAHDVSTAGDIQAASRQAWWTSMYNQLAGKWVRFVSLADDGTTTVLADGVPVTF